VLRSLLKYHGKPGHGASVEFKLKEGPITMLGMTSTYEGKFKFVSPRARACAAHPGHRQHQHPRLLPARHPHVPQAVGGRGPHAPLRPGVGHHARALKRIGEALGIESVIVAP